MLQKTKGIVLHTLKYNDTSIIVDMYTELSGRTSFSRSRTPFAEGGSQVSALPAFVFH